MVCYNNKPPCNLMNSRFQVGVWRLIKLNTDRRLILVGGTAGPGEEEEEEEYAFEDDEEVAHVTNKWMAIARYCSCQEFKTWVLFNELSKAWGRTLDVLVRELCDIRFLVGFGSELLWKKAVEGGPWTFKGDVVIFVAYDGLQRFFEIVNESNIPVKLMTDCFVRALGAKLGTILEVGEARMNYKRVKVDFPLAKALLPEVQKLVKGYGVLKFAVMYENVPQFCFVVVQLDMRSENALRRLVRRGGGCSLGRHYAALRKRGMLGGI